MLHVFLTVILPTFLVAAAGFGVQRWRKLAAGPLSQVTFYVLSPAIIFHSMLRQQMPASTSLRIVAASLAVTLLTLALAVGVSRALRHSRPMQSAFILASVFPNTGNMGLPIALLAFGEAGLATAVAVFVTQAAIGWSLGIYVGARTRSPGLAPLKEVLKAPVLYAMAAALVLLALGWHLPTTLAKPIELLSNAALPAMLLVLGFQLGSGLDLRPWGGLLAASFIRLTAGALLAYLVTLPLGLTGVDQQVIIVGMAMPTAVFTTIVATEFDANPRFVTSAVVTSTLASLLTLTVVITKVQDWLS
ncbi:MAG: AEC family transporter [Dehalococcoidia bacterium]|nr:AEC family transporter [Dehalococcoidia bacterium]